jgi:metal-sulfur cluster biosynthetic enzyme
MVLAENQILERLKSVIDPEIGINIVDLGLIYNVESGDTKVNITMTLTTPGCPMHSSMPNWVKESILSITPNLEVDVHLVWQPPWTPEDMSDDAKRQLGRLR